MDVVITSPTITSLAVKVPSEMEYTVSAAPVVGLNDRILPLRAVALPMATEVSPLGIFNAALVNASTDSKPREVWSSAAFTSSARAVSRRINLAAETAQSKNELGIKFPFYLTRPSML